MRTAVRVSCTGKQGGGVRRGKDQGKTGTKRNPCGGKEEEKPAWEDGEEDIPLWEGEEKEAQRETEAHRARGLRLTGAVGGWWERANLDNLRIFDIHLE